MEVALTNHVLVVEPTREGWQITRRVAPAAVGDWPRRIEVYGTPHATVREALCAAGKLRPKVRGKVVKLPVMLELYYNGELRAARAECRRKLGKLPVNRIKHIRRALFILAKSANGLPVLTSAQLEALYRVVEGYFAGCNWNDYWWRVIGDQRRALLTALPPSASRATRQLVDAIITDWQQCYNARLAATA